MAVWLHQLHDYDDYTCDNLMKIHTSMFVGAHTR
jgi:hypothetical protein